MEENRLAKKSQIIYFSHGGGPLPLLGDLGHQAMVAFMRRLPEQLRKPDAIEPRDARRRGPSRAAQLHMRGLRRGFHHRSADRIRRIALPNTDGTLRTPGPRNARNRRGTKGFRYAPASLM